MAVFIDEERSLVIDEIVSRTTALPMYENDVTGDCPDYIYIGMIVYEKVDTNPHEVYIPIVSLKFQRTFDDTYMYHMLDQDYNTTIFEEIQIDE